MKKAFIQFIYATDNRMRLVDVLFIALENLTAAEFGDVFNAYKERMQALRNAGKA